MVDTKTDGGFRLGTVTAISVAASLALTALIAALSPLLARWRPLIGPDLGAAHYYWQLAKPTLSGGLSAWALYAVHQAGLFYLVWKLSKEKAHPDAASRLNVAALAWNGAFVLVHVLQTHLFYDGLAQYVPVWSSQYSVIGMLVIILYSAAPRRGLILGKFGKWDSKARAWVLSWHGYYIAWALCYTFWFHPTEGDYGLLTGFFYMFLLFVQLSLPNTKLHLALGWVALLEVLVGVHGPAIAIQKAVSGISGERDVAGPGIWIMFASGFLFMFAFTGQYGLKLKGRGRALVLALYAALIAGLFAWRGYDRLFEVAFIPTALYGGAIALAVFARAATFRRKAAAPAV
ncbi:MAG: hypothetical protein KBC36_03040 [Spirochaetia bacterium]|nr:hypothetical protein [Spirochaetia bacterium]